MVMMTMIAVRMRACAEDVAFCGEEGLATEEVETEVEDAKFEPYTLESQTRRSLT